MAGGDDRNKNKGHSLVIRAPAAPTCWNLVHVVLNTITVPLPDEKGE